MPQGYAAATLSSCSKDYPLLTCRTINYLVGDWGFGIDAAADPTGKLGVFDASKATPGTGLLYYGIAGTCGDTTSISVTINPLDKAKIKTPPSFCNSDPITTLALDTANSTNYNTTSDYRLKEDYKPIVNPLETIRSLNPINFKWIDNDSRIDGFIAHEVQEVVYNAVTGDKDEVDSDGNPVYQQMDVSKLIPLLTAALQEQQKMIDSLVKEVNDLKNVVR